MIISQFYPDAFFDWFRLRIVFVVYLAAAAVVDFFFFFFGGEAGFLKPFLLFCVYSLLFSKRCQHIL